MTTAQHDSVSPPRPLDAGCGPFSDRVPLVALLGRSEAAFNAEFDRRLKGSEFCALSLAHSRNVLRHLGSGPQRASQLVTRCDVSKQAISQQIALLEREGYLESTPDPTDQRARILALTAKGQRAQQLVEAMFIEIEDDWATQLGARDAAALRRILTKVVEGQTGPASTGSSCS